MAATLASVFYCCAVFLRDTIQWAVSVYTSEFLASIEYMSEAVIIRELTILLEQCSCEQIGQLYEDCLQFSKAATVIAADILGQRGDAGELCVRPLISELNHFGKYFILIII